MTRHRRRSTSAWRYLWVWLVVVGGTYLALTWFALAQMTGRV